MRRFAASLSLLLLTACATAPSSGPAAAVDAIIAAHPQQTIAVAYRDLATGETLLRNEKEVFHAASTMKVPVMLGIFEAISSGELRLDQPVRVKNQFVSILDGSPYSLESREDSDPQLYDLVGTDVPLEDLIRRMIVRSSNLSTNILIEFIGAPRVMQLMRKIGANDIRVLRGVEDDKAYHAGMSNTTTAYDLMLIFEALAEERVLTPEASSAMMEILLAQEHNDGIPAGLPAGTRVAHKTGSITEIAHDGGVVIRPDGTRYVLVVLTRGFEKHADAEKVIAGISKALW